MYDENSIHKIVTRKIRITRIYKHVKYILNLNNSYNIQFCHDKYIINDSHLPKLYLLFGVYLKKIVATS